MAEFHMYGYIDSNNIYSGKWKGNHQSGTFRYSISTSNNKYIGTICMGNEQYEDSFFLTFNESYICSGSGKNECSGSGKNELGSFTIIGDREYQHLILKRVYKETELLLCEKNNQLRKEKKILEDKLRIKIHENKSLHQQLIKTENMIKNRNEWLEYMFFKSKIGIVFKNVYSWKFTKLFEMADKDLFFSIFSSFDDISYLDTLDCTWIELLTFFTMNCRKIGEEDMETQLNMRIDELYREM